MKNLYIITTLILFLSACTDKIDLKIQNSEPVLIVEAKIKSIEKELRVELSKSTEFDDTPNSPLWIANANVFVTINGEAEVEVPYTENGKYIIENILVDAGTKYNLRIVWGEKEYKSSSSMREIIPILDIKFAAAFRPGNNDEDGIPHEIQMFVNPPLDSTDYYFTRISILDTFTNNWINESYLQWNDEIYSKGPALFPYRETFAIGDSLKVEFSHISKEVFEFYETLDDVKRQNPSSLAPMNPTSNISNDAIGYFGAFKTYQKYIRVKP